MTEYDEALDRVLRLGKPRTNLRTGKRTRMICGLQCRFDLSSRFPILTRRKTFPRAIFAELLWFLSGSTNNQDLQALGSNIWTPWVDREFEEKHRYVSGSLGPVYGFQLRYFGGFYGDGCQERSPGMLMGCPRYGERGFDQLRYMVDLIRTDPSSRRIMFDLWDPSRLTAMRLPPCHFAFQVVIDDEGRMDGMLTMRSADLPLGVPANIQFYSALILMLAQQTGYTPGEFVLSLADAHIYEEQILAVEEYLASPPRTSPRLALRKADDITSYSLDDFQVTDYAHGPVIKIPVAV